MNEEQFDQLTSRWLKRGRYTGPEDAGRALVYLINQTSAHQNMAFDFERAQVALLDFSTYAPTFPAIREDYLRRITQLEEIFAAAWTRYDADRHHSCISTKAAHLAAWLERCTRGWREPKEQKAQRAKKDAHIERVKKRRQEARKRAPSDRQLTEYSKYVDEEIHNADRGYPI